MTNWQRYLRTATLVAVATFVGALVAIAGAGTSDAQESPTVNSNASQQAATTDGGAMNVQVAPAVNSEAPQTDACSESQPVACSVIAQNEILQQNSGRLSHPVNARLVRHHLTIACDGEDWSGCSLLADCLSPIGALHSGVLPRFQLAGCGLSPDPALA
ncbi:MAG: hypothetical protein WCJ30_20500, partial [Deltaproteobacteria bacterium]